LYHGDEGRALMGDIITRTLSKGRVAYYARYIELDGTRVSRATGKKTLEEAKTYPRDRRGPRL
jgi:hypothetical protein